MPEALSFEAKSSASHPLPLPTTATTRSLRPRPTRARQSQSTGSTSRSRSRSSAVINPAGTSESEVEAASLALETPSDRSGSPRRGKRRRSASPTVAGSRTRRTRARVQRIEQGERRVSTSGADRSLEHDQEGSSQDAPDIHENAIATDNKGKGKARAAPVDLAAEAGPSSSASRSDPPSSQGWTVDESSAQEIYQRMMDEHLSETSPSQVTTYATPPPNTQSTAHEDASFSEDTDTPVASQSAIRPGATSPPTPPSPRREDGASETSSTSKGKGKARETRPPESVPIHEVEPLAAYTCPVCFSPPTYATITPCGHVLCGECLFTAVKTTIQRGAYTLPPGERMTARCPVCRAPIPGWDGRGGGVIGLKPRAVFSL